MIAQDLNGDSALDIMTVGGGVSVLIGNGDGSFRRRATYAMGEGSGGILADINGDNRLDLLARNYIADTVSVMIGNGDGTFKAETTYLTGAEASAIAVGHLNGDAFLDVVTSSNAGGGGAERAYVLLGNGDGTLRAGVSYEGGNDSLSMKVVDLNSDGIADLIKGSAVGTMIVTFMGNGDGTFKARVPYTAGIAPGYADAADLNNDGRQDVVVANYSTDRISVLLGNGNGTFQAPTSFQAGDDPRALSIVDLDKDGALDVVTSDVAGDSVSVFFGTGTGSFRASRSYAVGDAPSGTATGDVNGDGVSDILVANAGSATVRILTGTPSQSSGMRALDLSTQSGARDALVALNRRQENIGLELGTLGASQSRVETSLRNLSTLRENLAVSVSRIMDADVAHEAASLTQNQIMQQTAQAVLAQANQAPSLVLSLL